MYLEEGALEDSWRRRLGAEFRKSYMLSLADFLKRESLLRKKKIFPSQSDVFSAFNMTPFERVKVVIIGQDPYHGPSQAHGLSFSVLPGVKIPPSLANIYKELSSDLGLDLPSGGCLKKWAQQGVFMLNSTLTVEKGRAGSHQKKGWEEFTDKVVELLNQEREGLVFFLWGSFAQKKGEKIDSSRHFVLSSPHPSPLSAYRGFLGSRPFSRANKYLVRRGSSPIDWAIE